MLGVEHAALVEVVLRLQGGLVADVQGVQFGVGDGLFVDVGEAAFEGQAGLAEGAALLGEGVVALAALGFFVGAAAK